MCKIQTFKASDLVTLNAPKAKYQLKVTDPSESQYEMLSSLQLKKKDYIELISHCKKVGIDFMSTPYSLADIDFLVKLNVSAIKIASGQLTELPFLSYAASFNLPIYLSTGMSHFSEVLSAVESIKYISSDIPLTVLQCTTNYPSKIEESNLNVLDTFNAIPDIKVGYSDHVKNNFACFAAVAKGARVIEKHFTLDKEMTGPDHSCSLNPTEFRDLVHGIREIEKSLGSFIKKPSKSEELNMYGMKRSLVYSKPLTKGTKLKKDHFKFKRPFNGLSPNSIEYFIGKTINRDVNFDEIVSFEHI